MQSSTTNFMKPDFKAIYYAQSKTKEMRSQLADTKKRLRCIAQDFEDEEGVKEVCKMLTKEVVAISKKISHLQEFVAHNNTTKQTTPELDAVIVKATQLFLMLECSENIRFSLDDTLKCVEEVNQDYGSASRFYNSYFKKSPVYTPPPVKKNEIAGMWNAIKAAKKTDCL